jgi:vitamin B12 transporter
MKLHPLNKAISVALLATPILATASTQLEQIVVSANNTEQSLRDVTSNITLISAEEIAEKQYQTLADALKTVPGLSIKGSGGLGKATSVYLRGFESKNILILVDGIDMTDPAGLGGANLENISLSEVARIEIIKGPQSGVWGANATAGVINIVTQKGQDHTRVDLEVGSNHTRKITTSISAGNEQFDFNFNLMSLATDGFSALRPAQESHTAFEKDGYQQNDVSFKMGIQPVPQHRIETLIKRSSGHNDYDSTTNPDDTINSGSFEQSVRQLQYLFNTPVWNSRVHISQNSIDRTHIGYGSEYHGLINEQGVQLGRRYGEDNFMQIALNHKEYLAETTYLTRDRFNNVGYALTHAHRLFGSLTLNESLRYDEFDRFDNAVTGKIGFRNLFTPEVFIGANIGTAYNAPTLSQLSRPNPAALSPEKSASYDITLGLYGLEATYFDSRIDDLIEYVPSPPPYTTPYYYKNADQKVISKGVELAYKRSFDALKTDMLLNYTWLSAKNENGDDLPYRPKQQGNLALDYYGIKRWHIGLETRYIGEQFATTYNNNDADGDPYHIDIGHYFVTDLKADYQITPSLSLYGRIINLTDDAYTENVSKATQTTADYVYSNGGRQFFMGIKGQL